MRQGSRALRCHCSMLVEAYKLVSIALPALRGRALAAADTAGALPEPAMNCSEGICAPSPGAALRELQVCAALLWRLAMHCISSCRHITQSVVCEQPYAGSL